MTTLRSPILNVMFTAVRKAIRGLKRDFGEVDQLQVSRKGPADFVTAADTRVEGILREELARARPGYGFLMEEAGEEQGTDRSHRWIIDPIDGTTNFLHAIPHFAVSVALEREGQLVAGLVYNPITEELYTAEKGYGAFLNDRRRLRVSARQNLADSLIATGIPFKGRPGHERFHREAQALMPEVAGIRRFGAASLDLAHMAAGRYEGYWEHNLKPWDMAAGIVLVREAGGIVQDINGRATMLETGSILAANDALLRPLQNILQDASK